MLKYVIWGAGYRGRKLLSCMNRNSIIAFVDRKLCGRNISGIPCISFEEYEKKYIDAYIIISQVDFKPLEKKLKEKSIVRYFVLEYSPSELPNYDEEFPFEEIIKYNKITKKMRIRISGLNLFSILLYDYMCENSYDVSFLDNNDSSGIVNELKNYDMYRFVEEDFIDDDVCYLVTDKALQRNIDNEINLFEFKYLNRYKKFKRIRKFYNRHDGERCFVVATGPSLKIDDLDKLYRNNEYAISVNTVFRAFGKTKWRPNYLVVTDTATLDEYFDEIIHANIQYKFISDRQYRKWEKICREDIIMFHLITEYYEAEGPKFSFQLDNGVYYGYTVLYAALQLAVYMGFKKIYIIGADCDLVGDGTSGCNHFIKEYDDKFYNKKVDFDYERMFSAYKIAEEKTKNRGARIYNATRGGRLEVFQRVEFDSLFSFEG